MTRDEILKEIRTMDTSRVRWLAKEFMLRLPIGYAIEAYAKVTEIERMPAEIFDAFESLKGTPFCGKEFDLLELGVQKKHTTMDIMLEVASRYPREKFNLSTIQLKNLKELQKNIEKVLVVMGCCKITSYIKSKRGSCRVWAKSTANHNKPVGEMYEEVKAKLYATSRDLENARIKVKQEMYTSIEDYI